MFTFVVTSGQIAMALAAVGGVLVALYHFAKRFVIKPTRQLSAMMDDWPMIVKAAQSLGTNGKESAFQMLHKIDGRCDSFDMRLDVIEANGRQMQRVLMAQDVALERLLERSDGD